MLYNFKLFSRVYYALSLLLIVIVFGTVGYMLVEDWSLTDAFFMTVITISTVGFNEVNELSTVGQLFTAALIISSFGIFAYAISAITTYLVGGEYRRYFREYKVNKNIGKMSGHVIVCGYGRVGKQAVAQLRDHNQRFVIIEAREKVIDEILIPESLPFVGGDATQDDLLVKASIQNASALITTLPKDSDNLFVVLSARELNRNLTIISRASQSTSVKKLRIAGADNVIMPDSVGGAHMASLVITPDVMEFLDLISIQGEADANLEEITFENLPEDFRYKTIGEIDARRITGVNIIGYRSPEDEYVINPSHDTKVVPNSKLFVLGTPKQIRDLNSLFGLPMI